MRSERRLDAAAVLYGSGFIWQQLHIAAAVTAAVQYGSPEFRCMAETSFGPAAAAMAIFIPSPGR